MDNLKQVFKELGDYSVERIRASLKANDRVATGKTNAAIRQEFDNNGFKVFAPKFIDALQDGRKPSSGSGGGSGGFFDQIVEWCRARGIDEKAAYPIYRKINAEGYEGKPGIIDDPINDIVKNTKFVLAKTAKSQILNSLKTTKRN